MYRQQLTCILVRLDRGAVGRIDLSKSVLDGMFSEAGCIHFAAFALLPPVERETQPTLALELAVDPGVAHGELVDRLVAVGFDVLWSIYGSCLPAAIGGSELVRRAALNDLLRRNLHGADGGFVGARDRNVGQITAEWKLFEAARSWLQQHPATRDETRSQVARRVADWAGAHPRFCWAAEPAPRSFWRGSSISQPVRALLVLLSLPLPGIRVPVPGAGLVAILPAVLAALGFAGLVALLPFLAIVGWPQFVDSPLVFGQYAHWSRPAIGFSVGLTVFTTVLLFVAVSAIRVTTVAAFSVLLFGMIMGLAIIVCIGILGFSNFLGLLGALEVLVRAGLLALLLYAALWAAIIIGFLAALLLSPPWLGISGVVGLFVVIAAAAGWVIHFALACLVDYGARAGLGFYPMLQQTSLFGVPALDAIVVVVFLAFSLIGLWLARKVRLPPFAEHTGAKKLDRLVASREPLSRGHQVHPLVVACEGELAQSGRVNHIFNLSDVRSYTGWNAFWLRYFLRLVSYLGHTVFTEGTLGNAAGIRFGHWYVIDNDRRLLFCSNYDGSFGGYLDEFINGASEGINLFWRWTELRKRGHAMPGHPDVKNERSFPSTKLWAFGGCKYEQWFKSYARDGMLPHVYRFEAYKQNAMDVQRAARLRDAIAGARTPVKDDQLLRALES